MFSFCFPFLLSRCFVPVFLFSVCTTYLHYGTEIRMYMMLLLVSAMAVYCAVRYFYARDRHNWFLAAGFFAGLLPFIHSLFWGVYRIIHLSYDFILVYEG